MRADRADASPRLRDRAGLDLGEMMGGAQVPEEVMPDTVSTLLIRNYALTHRRALGLARDLGDAEFGRTAAPSLHSAGWQLWHIARWTDVLAWRLASRSAEITAAVGPGERPIAQIWERDGLAAAWGLPAGEMGQRDTGTLMSDGAAEGLILPAREFVIDYVERAFAFGERVVAAIDDIDLLKAAPGDPDGDSYAENILVYAEHDSRHLGMMEAIAGLLGLSGSTTT